MRKFRSSRTYVMSKTKHSINHYDSADSSKWTYQKNEIQIGGGYLLPHAFMSSKYVTESMATVRSDFKKECFTFGGVLTCEH